MPQSRAMGANTPIPTSDMALDLWRVTGQLYTEVATTGSRHTKWSVDSRTQEPSKLYSAEHDQTRVDTIITVIFAIIEITHETTSLDPPTHVDSPVLSSNFVTQGHREDAKPSTSSTPKSERNCC